MGKRSYKPDEIVAKLRQVDVLHSQGMTVADAIREIGVSEVTFYRWRREYGGDVTPEKWSRSIESLVHSEIAPNAGPL